VLFGRKRATCAQDLPDELETLAPYIDVRGKHRRQRGERGFRVDQQDVKLLAHEHLERRQRHIAMLAPNAPQRLEAALVDRASREAYIEQPADDGLAQPAGGNARSQLGDPLLEQLPVQWVLAGLAQLTRSGGIDTGGGLQRR